MEIIRATLNELDAVADLFDQYRQFYEQPADLAGCHAYIQARLANDESIIFLALADHGAAVGFTQLYNSFCSVAMQPIVYLYDLYVAPAGRRQGTGKALLAAAKEYAQSRGASRLTLETAGDNRAAQALYEQVGYRRDTAFYTYHFRLG